MKELIQVEQKGIGYSGTTVTFIFTNLCFLFWANLLGLLGPGADLAVGIIQLGVFVSYHVAAIKLFNRNDELDGNVFLIFATFFGGVGGLTNVVSTICNEIGVEFSTMPVAFCWLFCGIMLICILPCYRFAPWSAFVMFALAGVSILLMGLMALGLIGASIAPVIAWLLFIVGILGLYMAIAGLNGFTGVNLPMGKPIFKQNKSNEESA